MELFSNFMNQSKEKSEPEHEFLNLGMGLVDENFVIVKNEDVADWEARGFRKIENYPIFHYSPNPEETIMLGKPLTIRQFGIGQVTGSKILEVSPYGGDYGMGGPGFLVLKIEGSYGVRLLNYCVWGAGEYVLLNDRILQCHPKYDGIYHPWIDEEHSVEQLDKMLSGLYIKDVELTDESVTIWIGGEDSRQYQLSSCRFSERFPEKGGTGEKSSAFEEGKMEDYWLVTYDGTVLEV